MIIKKINWVKLILTIILIISLVGCAEKEYTFIGKGKYWAIDFKLENIRVDNEKQTRYDYVSTLEYIKSPYDIKSIKRIKYEVLWLHKDAEIINENGNRKVVLTKPQEITKGAVVKYDQLTYMRTGENPLEDKKLVRTGMGSVKDMSEKADYIVVNVEWETDKKTFSETIKAYKDD